MLIFFSLPPAEEHLSLHIPPVSGSGLGGTASNPNSAYPTSATTVKRPGSSLGIVSSSVHPNSTSNRARRVTIEEKYRQEREREAEIDEYERILMAEDAAEAERTSSSITSFLIILTVCLYLISRPSANTRE